MSDGRDGRGPRGTAPIRWWVIEATRAINLLSQAEALTCFIKLMITNREVRCLVAALLLASFVSCTTAGRVSPDSVIIPDVPFFSQEAYQCGPASLAMAMDYWYRKMGKGDWITPERIANDIYSPSARGVLGIDLELFARSHGFEALQYSGSMADLREKVDKGVPLIILVDYGFSVYQANHFMVVKGSFAGGVVVNSGSKENQTISEGELGKIWKKTGYWALAVAPLR